MTSPIFSDTAAGKINWALVEFVYEKDEHVYICFSRREVKLTKVQWGVVVNELDEAFRQNKMDFVLGIPRGIPRK